MRRGVSPGACAEEAGSHVPRHGCTHAQQARPPHGTLRSRQVALLHPSSSRQAAAERAAQQVAGTRLIRLLLFSLSLRDGRRRQPAPLSLRGNPALLGHRRHGPVTGVGGIPARSYPQGGGGSYGGGPQPSVYVGLGR